MIALVAGVVLLAIAAGGAAALLRPEGLVAFLLAAVLLAFGAIVLVSHGLSVFEAYERGWFLAALAALAAVAAVAVALVGPPAPALRRGAVLRHLGEDGVVATLAVVATATVGYVAALAAFTPPTENDALTYHLTRAILWVQQSSLEAIPDVGDWRINEFPRNAELLQAWTMLLSGSVRWAPLVQVAALVVAVVAIYGVATRLGLGRRAAAFGALVYPTLPVVALQAPIAKNDVVVAALAAVAAFFLLGRTVGDLALAALAILLLLGTKVTALLVLPVLVLVALLRHVRGPHGRLVLAATAAAAVGGVWYAQHVDEEAVSSGGVVHGSGDRIRAFAARVTRYAVEAVELPGAWGRNALLYVVVGAALGALGVLTRRRSLVVAGAIVPLALLALPLEEVLHRVYWRGWEAVGYERATLLGAGRDPVFASAVQSWYGPVGLAAVLAALVLVWRAARRGSLPWVSVALAAAPVVVLLASAAAIGYHPFSGRYVMGGVALSAATWGVLRSSTAVSWALVAAAATTVLLSLLASKEKPSGIGVLEGTSQPSVWTLPREWSQNIKPELALVTRWVDDNTEEGSTIALTRSPLVYPFVYVGWPEIEHTLVYADTLAEASERGAEVALLPDAAACEPGWAVAVDSAPWTLWRRAGDALCPPG